MSTVNLEPGEYLCVNGRFIVDHRTCPHSWFIINTRYSDGRIEENAVCEHCSQIYTTDDLEC